MYGENYFPRLLLAVLSGAGDLWCLSDRERKKSTDGGGWLVIARRAGGRRSFNKNWRHYKKGFGPLDKDFWLGLDSIVHLTSSSLDTELHFDMQSENGSWYYVYYNQMMVGPESTNYTLPIRGYDPNRSTIFDAFSFHDQLPFSTKDSVNLNFDVRVSCRRILNETGAGWWWGGIACFQVNLSQEYYVVGNTRGDKKNRYEDMSQAVALHRRSSISTMGNNPTPNVEQVNK